MSRPAPPAAAPTRPEEIDAFNPLDYKVFQTVFGMIITLLIAMKYKYSIVRMVLRRESITEVKRVNPLASLALARNFVILDPDISPGKVAAPVGVTPPLGVTYRLLRERDDRLSGEESSHEGR